MVQMDMEMQETEVGHLIPESPKLLSFLLGLTSFNELNADAVSNVIEYTFYDIFIWIFKA